MTIHEDQEERTEKTMMNSDIASDDYKSAEGHSFPE